MNILKSVLSLCCLVVLSACEAEPKMVLSPDFGTAVQHNMAVHIINPPDSLEPAQAPEFGGDRAARAYERMLVRPSGGGGLTKGTAGAGVAKP